MAASQIRQDEGRRATLVPEGAASLESILCTEELRQRPPRAPDYAKENRALVALAAALAESPTTILQTLSESIIEVTGSDSAGVSLLTTEDGGKRFYWPAIAGVWSPHVGGGTPRDFGPCGDVLDRNASLLFRHLERRYTYFAPVTPPAVECLLVPFYVGDKAVGTIWSLIHGEDRKFDAEDERLMETLGKVASLAYQTLASIDDLKFQIAERQKAEGALRELNETLARRVEAETRERMQLWCVSQDLLVIAGLDGKYLSVNPAWTAILGWSEADLLGKSSQWLLHPDDRERTRAEIDRLAEGHKTSRFENRLRAKDGSYRWVSWNAAPDRGRIYSMGRDITEHKQAEAALRESAEALRRSEAYLAQAQKLSHTGTIVLGAMGPVYWSKESYRIWDLDPLHGLPDFETVLQRVHPDDRDRVRNEFFEALRQDRSYAIEYRIVLPDGTVKYLASTGHSSLSADGEHRVISTHVDVTERKRAEEEHERLRQLESDLAHVNRLSMMGELAASLAHEVLHPIATARNNARAGTRFLQLSPPNLDEARNALGCVVRDVDRAKDIVGRMRDHIKKAPPRREPFDLNEAVSEVIVMVRSAIAKSGIAVSAQLMDGLVPVQGDRVQLQQVVMNLILNGVEAMGSIEVGPRELSIRIEQEQARGALVEVRDSGPGLAPGDHERVFEPFYTTKSSGVGMGLSICRSIINGHGGRLWVTANEPRGAVFQFTLPAAQADL